MPPQPSIMSTLAAGCTRSSRISRSSSHQPGRTSSLPGLSTRRCRPTSGRRDRSATQRTSRDASDSESCGTRGCRRARAAPDDQQSPHRRDLRRRRRRRRAAASLTAPFGRGLAAADLPRHTRHVEERERDRAEESVGDSPAVPVPSFPGSSAPRAVAGEIRNVSFHTAVRGYDRHDVDRYVQRVNRAIAELEIASSPQSAVRHALDRVGEQTSGILQRARETADEIFRTARSEAEETVERAKAQAGEINADARAEADRILAEAGENVTRAKSEASEIVARATKDAEDILVRADSQVVERRAREEQTLEEIRLKAESQMDRLRAEADAVKTERRLVLDQIQELAARLEELVESSRTTVEPESGQGPDAELDAAPGGEPAPAGDDVAEDAV